LIEQIIDDIFSWHIARLGLHESRIIDPHVAGAEWWVMYLDGRADEVDWHWDVDGAARELEDIRHPYLATVTYLEAGGRAAPTVMIDGCYKAWTLASGEALVRAVHLSTPLLGKHICFDGRLLHAAPSDLSGCFAKKSGRKGARVTLLVNIWWV
jgi:hypothetical protein